MTTVDTDKPMTTDIKVMIPREWEDRILAAQGLAGERSTTAWVKKLVENALELLPRESQAEQGEE